MHRKADAYEVYMNERYDPAASRHRIIWICTTDVLLIGRTAANGNGGSRLLRGASSYI